ncbi:20 kDa chaperonin, chloroplastic-like protein [Tanacetum coccineum]
MDSRECTVVSIVMHGIGKIAQKALTLAVQKKCSPFVVKGHTYKDEKSLKFKRVQEAARKDIERHSESYKEMAAAQLTTSTCFLPSFDGLKSTTTSSKASSLVVSSSPFRNVTLRSTRGFVVKAATTVAPKAEAVKGLRINSFAGSIEIVASASDSEAEVVKGCWINSITGRSEFTESGRDGWGEEGRLLYTSLKPLGDRVLIKIKAAEEKSIGGILLPSTAQTKPQGGEVVAVGEGRTIGDKKIDIGVKTGTQVVYSKYSGTEVEFNGSNHLILKEDDIVGILETDEIKDLKPLSDRVLIKVEEAEETTAGGLLLTQASKEKPSIGTVIAVGPGPLNEEGVRTGVPLHPGNTVLYSKYAGNDFKGTDGTEYIALRASDVMAVLS